LAEAIRVETRIMAAGEAAAEELAGRLTADGINRELSNAGLPTVTVLEAATPALILATAIEAAKPSTTSPELSASNTGTGAVAADTAVASSSSFFSTPVLVGGIRGIVFLAGIVACFCRWKCKNHITAPSREMGQAQAPEEITPATAATGTLVLCITVPKMAVAAAAAGQDRAVSVKAASSAFSFQGI
jgi:hypothetical protein